MRSREHESNEHRQVLSAVVDRFLRFDSFERAAKDLLIRLSGIVSGCVAQGTYSVQPGAKPSRFPTDTEFVGNFLKWTGHRGAIGTAFALFMLGCGMVSAVTFDKVDIMRPVGPWVLLTGFALAIPAFVGLCVFVRCPRCRVRVIWHAVSRDAHPRGLNGILLATKCPFCSFPEAAASFIVCLVVLFGGMATAQSPRVTQPARANSGNGDRQFSVNVMRDRCPDFRDVKQGSGPSDFRECRVSEFGEFGAVDGETYYYAIYCLIPSDTTENGECGDYSFIARYHRARGLAVFVRNPSSENARLLFERVDREIAMVYSEKPEIVRNSAGTLLYLPVAFDGTGHGNDSDYYLREAGEWVPIEAAAWLAELGRRIPAGLGIWKGVWPDLRTMQAEAGLYRADDANCCPTGGIARIRLAIRSRQLVIDSVVIDKIQ
jgi:hypothetical protein